MVREDLAYGRRRLARRLTVGVGVWVGCSRIGIGTGTRTAVIALGGLPCHSFEEAAIDECTCFRCESTTVRLGSAARLLDAATSTLVCTIRSILRSRVGGG